MPKKNAVPRAWRISTPCNSGEYKRQHAGDEGKAGHQDRPQTQAAGLDSRLDAIHALILALLGKLNDEDGVFGREAEEHHQADLGEDVVIHRAQPDTAYGGQQAHGHDQDDGQRHASAFILRRQHQEDEDDAEREDVDERVACEDLLIGKVGSFNRGADGHVGARFEPPMGLRESVAAGCDGEAGLERSRLSQNILLVSPADGA
jgi:hypothetical protein